RRFSRVEDGVRTINMFGVRVGSYGPIWSALAELARAPGAARERVVQRRGGEAARTVFSLAPRLWPALGAALRTGDYAAALEIGVSTGLPRLVARACPTVRVGGIDRSESALARAAELAAVADASWIHGDFFAPELWPALDAPRGLFYTVHLHELLARGVEPTCTALAAIRARFPGWDLLAFEQPRLAASDRGRVSRVEWLYAQSNVLIHHVIGNGIVARHDEWIELFERAGYRVHAAADTDYLGYRAYRVGA
ncbi:MAG TPA: hypothetical protein VFG69_07620, partial [Nannocystaceae bacterium]|nr:hypothetical protein [Nannocystaceae bacterium]